MGPSLLGGCSQLLRFCCGALQRQLVLGNELRGLGLGRLGRGQLGLGGGLLDLDDSTLGVRRRLLRGCRDVPSCAELRSSFKESLFELTGAIGSPLGLHDELSLQLLRAGDGLVVLGME